METDVMNLKAAPFEKKIKLLSETEKAYVQGYLDKAVIDCQKARDARMKNRKKVGEPDMDLTSGKRYSDQ